MASIIQWNCRGLRSNLEELHLLISKYKPLAICLQETFLKDNDNLTIKNYEIFSVTSSSTDGRPIGGTSILIRNDIPHRQLNINTQLQAVAINFTCHKSISLCSIYLPPHHNTKINELESLLGHLPSPTLIVGDFNAHNPLWGCHDTNNKGNILEKFILKNNLCLFNDRTPTYLHPASGTFTSIDLSISSPTVFMDFSWEVEEDLCGSDHFPIILNIIAPVSNKKSTKWQLHRADWVSYTTMCEAQLNSNNYDETLDPVEYLTSTITTIANKCIPKSTTNSLIKRKPWFNDQCKAAITERKRALQKFKTQPNHENLSFLRRCRAVARRVVKDSKRKSWRDYVSRLNDRTSVKKTWDMVRKISGKNSIRSIKHLNVNGVNISDTKDIANSLAENFAKNSSTNNSTNKFQRFKNQAEKTHINFTSNNKENYNKPITIDELKQSLRKAHDSAAGPDDVHYQLLKHLPDTSLLFLLDIFNNIWETGNFPASWRDAIVIPIPKPGKDNTNPSNYRPISLTSCICKTMERIINDRLVWYLESNNLITEFQSGFRRQRSTTDQLVRFESVIRDAFIRGEHAVSVFFDLEKAYDTTWKHGILSDLYTMGLRGRLPCFIKSFMADRSFRVRFGTTTSDTHRQEMGVPQGSILSVTLFSVKMNSIVKCLRSGIDCSLYVDDFVICYASKNMQSVERQLQLCLNRLQSWADENGFKFSQTKTVCMHFCHKRHLHPDPTLTLNGVNIPVVEQTKFLGLYFDRKLNFIYHIKTLKRKCHKALNLLKVLSKLDWGADRRVLLRLYRSLIRSKLDYGSIVYGAARKSYLQMLEPVQNQALRICLGAFRTTPIESLHIEANEPPMHIRRRRLALQFALKLRCNPSNPTYETVFYPKNRTLYERKPKAIRSFGLRIEPHLENICSDLDSIAIYSLPTIPPWTMKPIYVDLSLANDKKTITPPEMFKAKFNEIFEKYRSHTTIFTDGSKDGGRVAAAAVIGPHSKQFRLPDVSSIFTAELKAIILALEHIFLYQTGSDL